ncbi:peptidoglycan editing factor PgeF [Simkania negevensis]|uniref:Purine nucleoside phosphorylase n=1 Tax=Simkania negevensis TaxID=83561 RepID=A0ABS3API2_9BACT|nr:peptidoglycan editing factor PgeF [Simkania negevensis]
MKQQNSDGLRWHEYEMLAEAGLTSQATLTKLGGQSPSPYDSLNISYDVGDDDNNVSGNIDKICNTLNLPPLVFAQQVHGNNVVLIRRDPPTRPPVCDAMITDRPNMPLMIKHADCQAALLYDPIKRALGVVHAGWKGLVQGVYIATLRAMQEAFGTQKENILVAISPSLGPDSSEFIDYEKTFPKSFWEYQHKPAYFNLWEIARMQLQAGGVLSHHIEIASVDTFQAEKEFFSYRRNNKTGRNATLAAL